MLLIIALALFVIWIVGFAFFRAMVGGAIHFILLWRSSFSFGTCCRDIRVHRASLPPTLPRPRPLPVNDRPLRSYRCPANDGGLCSPIAT